MTGIKYSLHDTVLQAGTNQPVENARVEIWNKDLIFDNPLGEAETDEQGVFQLEFTEADFREWFLDRRPDLFFKIFDNEELIHSTENSVLWNCERSP